MNCSRPDRLANGIQERPKEVSVQLGITPLAIEFSVPINRLAQSIFPKIKHLIFLNALFDNMMQMGSLSEELERVFDGEDMGEVARAANLFLRYPKVLHPR
jgi:hypothetical protein